MEDALERGWQSSQIIKGSGIWGWKKNSTILAECSCTLYFINGSRENRGNYYLSWRYPGRALLCNQKIKSRYSICNGLYIKRRWRTIPCDNTDDTYDQDFSIWLCRQRCNAGIYRERNCIKIFKEYRNNRRKSYMERIPWIRKRLSWRLYGWKKSRQTGIWSIYKWFHRNFQACDPFFCKCGGNCIPDVDLYSAVRGSGGLVDTDSSSGTDCGNGFHDNLPAFHRTAGRTGSFLPAGGYWHWIYGS